MTVWHFYIIIVPDINYMFLEWHVYSSIYFSEWHLYTSCTRDCERSVSDICTWVVTIVWTRVCAVCAYIEVAGFVFAHSCVTGCEQDAAWQLPFSPRVNSCHPQGFVHMSIYRRRFFFFLSLASSGSNSLRSTSSDTSLFLCVRACMCVCVNVCALSY